MVQISSGSAALLIRPAMTQSEAASSARSTNTSGAIGRPSSVLDAGAASTAAEPASPAEPEGAFVDGRSDEPMAGDGVAGGSNEPVAIAGGPKLPTGGLSPPNDVSEPPASAPVDVPTLDVSRASA